MVSEEHPTRIYQQTLGLVWFEANFGPTKILVVPKPTKLSTIEFELLCQKIGSKPNIHLLLLKLP